MNKSGYIYALVNPIELRIFYIGSTTQTIYDRLDNHLVSAKSNPLCNPNLKLEINNLKNQGFLPRIIELEKFEFGKYNCFDLNDREADWIKSFTNQGIKLANSNSTKKLIKNGYTGKNSRCVLTKAPNASKLDIKEYM